MEGNATELNFTYPSHMGPLAPDAPGAPGAPRAPIASSAPSVSPASVKLGEAPAKKNNIPPLTMPPLRGGSARTKRKSTRKPKRTKQRK